jgi:hypothetical protein
MVIIIITFIISSSYHYHNHCYNHYHHHYHHQNQLLALNYIEYHLLISMYDLIDSQLTVNCKIKTQFSYRNKIKIP